MNSTKLLLIIVFIWLIILTILFPVSYHMGYDKAKVESAKLTEETLKLANMLVNAKWRLHEVETQELDTTAVTLEFIDSLEWMEIHFRRYYLPEAPIEEEDSLGGK